VTSIYAYSRVLSLISSLLFGLVLGLPARIALAAEDWQTIATNSPNITFSIDKGSIERKGNLVYFWEKMIFAKPELKDAASGRQIKEKRVQRVMNCDDHTQGVVFGAMYAENGTFITSTSFDDPQKAMTAIPPNTVAEEELKLVCPPPSGKLYGVDYGG
jgi:hypothetical protein